MLRGYKVLDCDSHVTEPTSIWEQYLSPAFKSFSLSSEMTIQGEKIYHKLADQVFQDWSHKRQHAYPLSSINQFDSESHVRAMQQMGVDVSFLYPSIGMWILAIDTMPSQLAGAYTCAYNNWLHDFCSYNPKMLRGVGAINLHAPEEMVPELHRVAEFGWKAIFLRPNPVKSRLLSDAAYEPFWIECEKLGMAVAIHEGAHSRLPTTGADRFNTRFAIHACSHPMEQMMALLALIEGGVLERHPKLRVGFLESGCGWLPYWLWRLDEEYENLRWEVQDNVKLKPSEYFYRQCFIAVEPSEPYLCKMIQYIGPDNIIFGSDYPHMDHQADIIEQMLELEEPLSKQILEKILWDNAAQFYGLE